MLNIFPIQFLAPLAFFLLRLCVGIIFLRLGMRHLRNRDQKTINMTSSSPRTSLFVVIGILELLIGLLYTFGGYTQIAALGALFLTSVQILQPRALSYPGYPPRIFFALLFVCSLSLFITGAGVFAVDLPL